MTDTSATSTPPSRELVEEELDLRRLIDILLAGKWTIAAVVVGAVLLAAFYLFVTDPIYRADALVQIQKSGSSGVESLLGGAQQQSLFPDRSAASTEIEILRSRSVIGDVVDKLGLQLVARPQYFPVIGKAIARRRTPDNASNDTSPVEEPAGWLDGYAWSRAELDLRRFDIPESMQGSGFVLTATGPRTYRLKDQEGRILLEGRVGEPASVKLNAGEIRLFVAGLRIGDPPVNFTIAKRSWLGTVRSLSNRLKVTEKGGGSGILELSLEGEDRQHITTVLNQIAQTYLRQNIEAKTKEAEQSLAFLEEQLPELREQLDESEEKLNRYQEKQQAVNLDAEAEAMLNQAIELERRLLEMDLKRQELQQRYRPEHPRLESLKDQMQEIRNKQQQLEKKIGGLPSTQREMLSLRRDVEVNTELYTQLLNRAQELKIIKAGTTGNVRIVDAAAASGSPIKPKSGLTLMLAIMLGGMAGVGIVFGRAMLRRGITNPTDVEDQTGLPVYGVVPYSNWQRRQDRRAETQGTALRLLARERPNDVVTEALRSLRTSLHFAQMEADRNLFLVTGPAPGVGKSFVSINLAVLLAEAGRRVLVIDGDMRRGHLHKYVNWTRTPGFSEVLSGQANWREVVRSAENGVAFDLITSGELPPNPAELLMRPAAAEIFDEMKQAYDIVILDGPPILAVTDATVMSSYGAITFLVARAGETQIPEIQSAQKRLLQQHTTRLAGVIINGLRESDAKTYGAYYGYYQYSYKQKSD